VLTDPQCTRNVQAKVQAIVDGGEYSFPVGRLAQDDDPAFGVVKTLVIEYRNGSQALKATGQDPETITLPTPASTDDSIDLRRDAEGRLRVEVRQNGRYELQTADGKGHRFEVAALPEPREIEGPWDLRFPPNWGAPERVTLPKLISWSDHSDPGVKYFSGTATYSRTINLPADMFGPNRRWYLDLGQVQVMAQVKLNDQDLGLCWKPPYRVEITEAAQAGANTLEIGVVNLWPNRMIGDEQLPEDCNRNSNGTLRAWPQWVLDGKSSPTGRFTFTSWKLWKKDEPLLESGLLGPVILQAAERILVPRP